MWDVPCDCQQQITGGLVFIVFWTELMLAESEVVMERLSPQFDETRKDFPIMTCSGRGMRRPPPIAELFIPDMVYGDEVCAY